MDVCTATGCACLVTQHCVLCATKGLCSGASVAGVLCTSVRSGVPALTLNVWFGNLEPPAVLIRFWLVNHSSQSANDDDVVVGAYRSLLRVDC